MVAEEKITLKTPYVIEELSGDVTITGCTYEF